MTDIHTAVKSTCPTPAQTFENLIYFRRMGKSFVINERSMVIYDVSHLPTRLIAGLIPSTEDRRPGVAKSIRAPRLHHGSGSLTEASEMYEALSFMNDHQVDATTQEVEKEISACHDAPPPFSFAINPTHRCNLGCSYCFAEPQYLDRSVKSKADDMEESDTVTLPILQKGFKTTVMNREGADDAMDYMLQSSGKDVEVSFFGGEPMLEFDIIQYMVERMEAECAARDKKVYFAMTTNGTIATDKQIRFLTDHGFCIILSFDATRELHNKHRPFWRSDRGSYDTVLKNLVEKFLPSGMHIDVRATAPLEDIDFDVMGHAMLDIGADSFAIEPAFDLVDQYEARALRKAITSLEAWARSYVDLIPTRSFTFVYFTKMLERMRLLTPLVRPCGAGIGYVNIAADGSVWPCHLWTGNPHGDWQLGSVKEGITRPDLMHMFKHLNIHTRQWCKDCWARLYCGGYCFVPKDASQQWVPDEDYPRPAQLECDFWRELTEISAWVYTELNEKHPGTLERIAPFKRSSDEPWKARD